MWQVASAWELEMGSVEIKVRLHGSDEQVASAKAMIRERMDLWIKDHVRAELPIPCPDVQRQEATVS